MSLNKPARRYQTRRLGEIANRMLGETFARQGFASTELVTRWPDIVGAEISAHSEPIRMQWPRSGSVEAPDPATLVLRVEGPAAIEIQHLSGVILERVNRFFGWRAVGRLALRQAPLTRRQPPPRRPVGDPVATARIAASLTDVADEGLRLALARLGAAIKAP
jgi:hypothetical protein